MTLLLERGDIPGFKVGRRRRRHEKRGGAWVRGHRVSGLVQLCFPATVLPHNIGMPDNMSCKLIFRRRNHAPAKITRQEEQQPTALRVDAIDLACRLLAYRLARTTAIRIGWLVTAHGRTETSSPQVCAGALRVDCGCLHATPCQRSAFWEAVIRRESQGTRKAKLFAGPLHCLVGPGRCAPLRTFI